MSWILGCTSTSLSRDDRERFAAFGPLGTPPGGVIHVAAHHLIVAGGLPETLHHGALPDGGWAVAGLGLRIDGDRCRPLQAPDWARVLTAPRPDLTALDGHFVAVRWRGDTMEVFTDALGLRTLHVRSTGDHVLFSTRFDWLARLQETAAIDFEAFGSHWLTFNQLDTRSLLTELTRLGPGGHLQVRAGVERHLAERAWSPPALSEAPGAPFASILSAVLRPVLPSGYRLSLGLSGGLDSRLLLALLSGTARDAVQVHTFGAPDHPDVEVATQLAATVDVPHVHLHEPVPDADACWALLRTHVAQTQAVSPASAVLGLRYPRQLYAEGCWMIDGGFGEITRRQFYNRLLRWGRRRLQRGDGATLVPFFRFERADIFTPDVMYAMEQGTERALRQVWTPEAHRARAEPEYAADLLGVRVRLPNFFGFEQNRLDGLIPNYMPFAQPAVLRTVFSLPLRQRRNGRLVRRLIRQWSPVLTRYPLVKGGTTYPFRLPTVPAHLWTKLQHLAGRGYAGTTRRVFLATLRPLALEILHSDTVRDFDAYDHAKLTRLVEDYYDGAMENEAAVDWWLAFEAWRQEVGAA